MCANDSSVQFNLPGDWQIRSTRNITPADASFDGDVCVLYAQIAPESYPDESVWYLLAFRTQRSAKEWGSILLAPEAVQEDDGRPGEYNAVIKTAGHTDRHVFIKQGDRLVYARVREKVGEETAAFTPAFMAIARSALFA